MDDFVLSHFNGCFNFNNQARKNNDTVHKIKALAVVGFLIHSIKNAAYESNFALN
ncbi:hypothetical protein SHVI106290_04715 [Shewanella violacea]|uniref:Uncharacterized protein n=1 Tax=Shewanella violacea (strain JCM 10179 / CIP 106290 / LMG 19151 / DSS12) TaxID=637905 RepID=D4ZA93_SHEVD|nr:hypothetical protein SVI_2967 [Shewanella violacea DSS12]